MMLKFGFIDHQGYYRDQRAKSTWRYAREPSSVSF